MPTYAFRLPPGPRTVELAYLAEQLGYEAVWCPEIPAFGHDIYVTLARIAERTTRIAVGAAVLVPSFRHPMTQASAIATLEAIAPGRLRIGFGTGFTGRAGIGQRPLSLTAVAHHMRVVRGLLRGEVVDIDGGKAQIIASDGWLPERPIDVPFFLAAQGPKGRELARTIADGLISMGSAAAGFKTCLVSLNGTVLDDGEAVTSPRARDAIAPIVALAYHSRYTADPGSVAALPNGAAWRASIEQVPGAIRHLSIHRGHTIDVSNGHDHLVDVSQAKEMTFTGTRVELRSRLHALAAAGATGFIFGTSGVDVEREMHAFAEVAGLQPRSAGTASGS